MTDVTHEFDEEIRSECGHALEEILERRSGADFERLRAMLSDYKKADPASLQNAINLLGRWGDKKAVADIAAVLPRLDERGTINAIDALGRLGGADALRAVAAFKDDKSPDIRRFVVYALERIDHKKGREILQEMGRKDANGMVRKRARDALKAKQKGK